MGAGKSTQARRFLHSYCGTRLSFGDGVKEEVARAAARNEDEYEQIIAEMYDPEAKAKWRTALQVWGTDVRRKLFGENYWVEYLAEKLETQPRSLPLVIDDCRFWNEFDYLKAAGFHMIRLLPRPTLKVDDTHESERYWREFPVDVEIWPGNQDEVWEQVQTYLEKAGF